MRTAPAEEAYPALSDLTCGRLVGEKKQTNCTLNRQISHLENTIGCDNNDKRSTTKQ